MKRMIFIDPGSISSGWAIFKNEGEGWVYEISGTVKAKGDAFSRMGQMWAAYHKIATDYQPFEAHIERLNYKTHFYCIWSAGVIGGALASIGTCAVHQDVSPGTWKKHVGYENPASDFHKNYAHKTSSLDEQVAIAIGLYITEVQGVD